MDKKNKCEESKRNDLRSWEGWKLVSTIVILFVIILLPICWCQRKIIIEQRQAIIRQGEIITEKNQTTIAKDWNDRMIVKKGLKDAYTGGILKSTVYQLFLSGDISKEDFDYLNEFLYEFLGNSTVENINIYIDEVLKIIDDD